MLVSEISNSNKGILEINELMFGARDMTKNYHLAYILLSLGDKHIDVVPISIFKYF